MSNKERYVSKGFLYECRVNQQSNCENCPGVSSVSHDIVGCATFDALDNPIEHPFGARWIEQGSQSQFKFTMECEKNGSEVKKRVVQCGFETSTGAARFIDVRCMQRIGSKLVACISRPDGSVEIQIHPVPVDGSKTITLSNLGLSYC
ncbi:unnamed protein product [Soboliphyme baturini]|uniref:Uncharacterized protein n=1 Tax=Soboliphyme baturini TaxID=241478 RepID=A0A183ILH1_9BILA|nr:unnamed protein product [Soboliphyme baturini]